MVCVVKRKDEQYDEHTINIRRVTGNSTGYDREYEVELFIEDELIITATDLRKRGNPWVKVKPFTALTAYARSYIDGMTHPSN